MGHHLNRLDAKGRVSIPAPFRAALRAGVTPEVPAGVALVLRPSHIQPCVEGWPMAEFERLATPLETFDLFSEAHDDLATALYADAFPIESDREGRIVLPETLATHAGLGDTVAFMGMGRWFQIWEPGAAERRRAEARERSRQRNLTIPGAAGGHGTPRA
jgi:MraZ protein